MTGSEASAAADALRQCEQAWGRAGLKLAKDPDQRAEDRALIRRAHVLVQRSLLPESVLAEAIARPVDLRRQGRTVRVPAAVLTKRLFGHQGFRELVALVRERLPRADPVAAAAPAALDAPMTSEQLHEMKMWAASAGIRIREIPGAK